MNRLLIAAGLGGLVMFLLDPEIGARRRHDLVHVIQERSGTIDDARRASRRAAKTVGQLRQDLSGEPSGGATAGTWILVVGGIVLAAAAGAGLVYLLDPDRGRQRRAELQATVQRKQEELRAQGADVADQAKDRANQVREQVSKATS